MPKKLHTNIAHLLAEEFGKSVTPENVDSLEEIRSKAFPIPANEGHEGEPTLYEMYVARKQPGKWQIVLLRDEFVPTSRSRATTIRSRETHQDYLSDLSNAGSRISVLEHMAVQKREAEGITAGGEITPWNYVGHMIEAIKLSR